MPRYIDADAFFEKMESAKWYDNLDRDEVAEELLIEALREKAEREKGCEYCNPNPYGHGEAIKQLITQNFNDKAHIHTFVCGNGLHTIAYPSPQDTNLAKTYSKCKIINYCPVCGKRLEVEQG